MNETPAPEVVVAGVPPVEHGTTIVAKFCVRRGAEAAFASWQARMNAVVAAEPGFLRQTLVPPEPPMEPRWTVFHWFEDDAAAFAWLSSPARAEVLAQSDEILEGPHDIHVARAGAHAPAPISFVIESRTTTATIDAFRHWQQRVAAALSAQPGFQGYRLEPPIAGVRDAWLTVVRFESEAQLEAWLASPERRRLLEEGAELASERSLHTVESAFEQWFPAARAAPAQWKMSMIVLAVLFPTAFTVTTLLTGPLFRAGVPFWLTVFIGNAIAVAFLAVAVPQVSRHFRWWLPADADRKATRRGVAAVVGLYALALAAAAAWSAAIGG